MGIVIKNIKDVTDFSESISKGLVLVDFWAPWCGPCKRQSVILDDMVSSCANIDMTIVKVNIDEHATIYSKFNTRSTPTLIIYQDGVLKDTLIGIQRKDEILVALMKHCSKCRSQRLDNFGIVMDMWMPGCPVYVQKGRTQNIIHFNEWTPAQLRAIADHMEEK